MSDPEGAAARRRTALCAPAILLALAVALAGCAAPVAVRPATLQPLAAAVPDVEIRESISVRLSTGYTRELPAGSRWRAIGMLAEGVVYRPLNTVFAIEGRNVHEAYLVVRAGAVHGFYLPAEANYSPLSPPLSLPQGGQP